MKSLSYARAATPAGYECSRCAAGSCKLWRQYQTSADQIELLCALCAGAEQGEDVASIDRDGTVLSSLFAGAVGYEELDPKPRTDQIGGMVPAVPTEDGRSFWGYTSVPMDAARWWRALPSLPLSA